MERDCKVAVVGVTTVPVDVTGEPAGGFGPLKAVLEDIFTAYTNREVRLQLPAQNSLTHLFVGGRHSQK